MRELLSRALVPLTEWVLSKAKYAIRHPIKSLLVMVKIYLTLLLFAFFLVASFSSFAQTIFDGLTPTPKVDGFEFHYQGPLTFGFQFVNEVIGGNRELRSVPTSGEYCNAWKDFVSADDLVSDSIVDSNETTLSDGTVRVNLVFHCEVSTTFDTQNACGGNTPPCTRFNDDDFTFLYDRIPVLVCDQGSIVTGDECYSLLDVREADSCPDSASVPDFVLPADGSGSSNVCLPSDDGSRCAYSLDSSGEFYTYNFEANCYDSDIPVYDEDGLATTADRNPDQVCEDLGNGTHACVEDPDNVCSNGTCQAGCGFFGLGDQTEFICFAEDFDGDGIPDYADPDIDGDGIPNDEDLDSDGDGKDDPVFNNGGGGGGVVNVDVDVDVDVDTSDLEAAIDEQTDELKESLGNINGNLTTTRVVNFTIPDNVKALGEPNDYDERNFGTVLEDAVEEMQESPVFKAVDGFFEVSFSGSCPTYSAYIDYINFNLVIDHFCSPVMNAVWPIISAIVILVFSYLAFRVAVL